MTRAIRKRRPLAKVLAALMMVVGVLTLTTGLASSTTPTPSSNVVCSNGYIFVYWTVDVASGESPGPATIDLFASMDGSKE